MGQQQLLLLVLSTVIVGLATVAGIQAFSQNQIQANGDQLQQTALEIASDAQAWGAKPSQLGGGDISSADPTLAELGYGSSPYSTSSGEFTIESGTSGPASNACSNVSIPSGNSAGFYVHGVDTEGYGNEVCVGVAGTESDDIGTGLSLGS